MCFSDKSMRLSYDEYCALMCLLGAKNIQGTFVDESYNLSPDNFKKTWDKCQKSLSEKGYLAVDDETAKLDIALYCLLTECKKANRVYNIQISLAKDEPFDVTYYKSENALVCIKNNTKNNELILYVQSVKRALQNVFDHLSCEYEELSVDSEINVSLTQQEYFALMASVNIGNLSKAQGLIQNSIREEYSLDLFNALKESSEIVSITQFEDKEVYNHTLIFGEKLLWLVDAEDETSVKFSACDVNKLKQFIKDVFEYSGRSV